MRERDSLSRQRNARGGQDDDTGSNEESMRNTSGGA